MAYLFKDTDRAAYRLQVLADVFAASIRSFLQKVASATPHIHINNAVLVSTLTIPMRENGVGARLISPSHRQRKNH